MTAVCPEGHASATTDWCDRCGAPIAGASVAPAPPDDADGPDTSATPACAPCPRCRAQRAGRDRFCEDCGFDFVAGGDPTPPAAPGEPGRPGGPSWAVEVAADREYFTRTAPAGLSFPAAAGVQTVPLATPELRIGRTRSSDGSPEIALRDPAVSRLHARLVQAGDGSWQIVDEGSSNGTTVNDDPRPIAPHVPVPLEDGDRVHVGAWTTITVVLRNHAA